ncbi:hypothetical protein GCM10027051_19920 [Niabella terrae]
MKKNLWFLLGLIPVMAFIAPSPKIKIFLAGDSTCAIKSVKAYPENGWGMPFVYFWDSTVKVVNLAKNGRSTSSFRNDGLWQQVMDKAQSGDYVFIQFGHNDEVPTKKNATTPDQFRSNLSRYIKETRSKGAIPVLLTPVARRSFDTLTGKVLGTHDAYARIVREVAAAEHTPLFDLDLQAQQLYQHLGPEASKLLFVHLQPGEHPHYPKGKIDNTHFNELGARLVAQLVLKDIRQQLPELASRTLDSGVR